MTPVKTKEGRDLIACFLVWFLFLLYNHALTDPAFLRGGSWYARALCTSDEALAVDDRGAGPPDCCR